MNITGHALIRAKQRGFNQAEISLIADYGTEIKKPGKAREVFIRRKDLKSLLQSETNTDILNQLRRNRDKFLKKRVLVKSNRILTVYIKTRRRKHYD